ncbi:GNAT family N-acetyltransferase [Streptomyces sp. AJS327]|uniref:GNAT family N-acetyltransferase n=1 Tax=Streptomyces sp. AJS327 TaxID=2545265 RepID=UPI0015DECA08|nr:GNAT family N-acetyltransferase [Streptomyces sp. AJS327]MBA0053925.1 GNAT family N-acetyltransferase [Streptomyces sp. AJS327]
MRQPGEVWKATAEDMDAAVRAVGRASADEAVSDWVIPDSAYRERRFAEFHGELVDWLDGVRCSAELVFVGGEDGAIAGFAVWQYVDGRSAEDASSEAESASGGELASGGGEDEGGADGFGEGKAGLLQRLYGDAAHRFFQAYGMVAERQPTGLPYWYLSQTAVLPECRGRGYGGALLRRQLTRIDEERAGTWLEASTPRSRALYERHGFVAVGEPIVLPDDGPQPQPMWRQGRSAHVASDLVP